jgi:hypothetical protein
MERDIVYQILPLRLGTAMAAMVSLAEIMDGGLFYCSYSPVGVVALEEALVEQAMDMK